MPGCCRQCAARTSVTVVAPQTPPPDLFLQSLTWTHFPGGGLCFGTLIRHLAEP